MNTAAYRRIRARKTRIAPHIEARESSLLGRSNRRRSAKRFSINLRLKADLL